MVLTFCYAWTGYLNTDTGQLKIVKRPGDIFLIFPSTRWTAHAKEMIQVCFYIHARIHLILGYVSDPLVRLIHLFQATCENKPGFKSRTSSLTTLGAVSMTPHNLGSSFWILKFDPEPMCDVYETYI